MSSYEEFERVLVAVTLAAFALADVVLLVRNTPARADKRVLEWARTAQLPRDDQAFTAAVNRSVQDRRWSACGSLLGLLAGSPALFIDFGFLGLMTCLTGTAAGQLVGTWVVYTDIPRGRPAAGARPHTRVHRQLRPAELTAVGGAPLAPVVILLVGAASLGDQSLRHKAVQALVLGATLLLTHAGALLGLRHALAVEPPAAPDTAQLWGEAHRAQLVRDLIATMTRTVIPALVFLALAFSVESPDIAAWLTWLPIAAVTAGFGVMTAQLLLDTQPVRPALDRDDRRPGSGPPIRDQTGVPTGRNAGRGDHPSAGQR